MIAKKTRVVFPAFDDTLGDTRKESQIAADMRLNILGSDARAEEHAPHIAGYFEIDQARFDNGIDDDDFSTAISQVHERRHEPGVIAGRIAPDEENEIGVFEVFQGERGGACSERTCQSDSTCLVAIEAAIVDVVRAV